VTASWKIERADRVEADRLAAAVRDAAAERRAGRRDEADRLGRLLLGSDGLAHDPGLARTVPQILALGVEAGPDADGRDPLRSILDRLESTAEGCAWLLGRWAELRAPLERGRDWNEDQLVQAVQLSGRQPLDMTPAEWDDHTESRCFEDVDELEPGGEEIDEERQLAPDAAIEAQITAEDRRRLTRQLVEVLPEDEAGARAALLGVIERASGRLSELAAAHEARWEAEAAELAERMSFDIGPEEEQLWRYQFGCERSLRRTLDTLLKLRRGGRGQAPGSSGEGGRSAVPPSGRDEAVARAPFLDEACAPVAAPPAPKNEGPPKGDGDRESGGRASVRASSADAARTEARPPGGIPDLPSVARYEAIAPADAPPAPQNEARTPAVDHPGLEDEAIAPVRCGSTDPAAGATAGLPPGPVRADDPQSARWRGPETSPQHRSPETGNDSRPVPQEAAESRVPRPREVVAPEDRLPTGSEPGADEPVEDREARAVRNEATGPADPSGPGASEPAREAAVGPATPTGAGPSDSGQPCPTDGGAGRPGPMLADDTRGATNEATGPADEVRAATNEAGRPLSLHVRCDREWCPSRS
jgi:hypothetical protein